MEERPTWVPPDRDVLLAVGCVGALLGNCRQVAELAHVDLEAVELVDFAAAAASLRPLVILISSDIYAFDPTELDAVARSVGAARVLVELEEPCDRLVARISDALAEARGTRNHPPAAPVTIRARRPSSGIRWTATVRRTGT
jgi:hypothetical protein